MVTLPVAATVTDEATARAQQIAGDCLLDAIKAETRRMELEEARDQLDARIERQLSQSNAALTIIARLGVDLQTASTILPTAEAVIFAESGRLPDLKERFNRIKHAVVQ